MFFRYEIGGGAGTCEEDLTRRHGGHGGHGGREEREKEVRGEKVPSKAAPPVVLPGIFPLMVEKTLVFNRDLRYYV